MKKTLFIAAMVLLSGLAGANDNIGDPCVTDGYVSQTEKGFLLSCVDGKYQAADVVDAPNRSERIDRK